MGEQPQDMQCSLLSYLIYLSKPLTLLVVGRGGGGPTP